MAFAPGSELILHRACADHGLDHSHCKDKIDDVKVPGYDAAQRHAAYIGSMLSVVSGVTSIGTCALGM